MKNQSQQPRLAPCPFCGSEELELCNTHSPSFWVECECGVEVHGEAFATRTSQSYSAEPEGPNEADYAGLRPIFRKAADSAIAAWNRRQPAKGEQ